MGGADTSPTPIGARPATGGRVREYADGAERARAWRERQRARRAEGGQPPAVGGGEPPEASLAGVIEQLRTLLQSHRDEIAGLVARAEDAMARLSPPLPEVGLLPASRAEADGPVARAEEQVARAEVQVARAEEQLARAEEQVARAEEQLARAEAAGPVARAEEQLARANQLRMAAEGAALSAQERVYRFEAEVEGLRGGPTPTGRDTTARGLTDVGEAGQAPVAS